MTGPLRRVFVRRPGGLDRWQEFGWHAAPDPVRIAEEHEALCGLLEGAGAEVVVGEPLAGSIDAVYVHDPAAVTRGGAILLRPGKEARRIEVAAIERDLADAGIELIARLDAPAVAEGGDLLWLDERTLLVGRSYRTNDGGIAALQDALPDVEVISFDLPHRQGPGEVLHLLSLISPLDDDLALVYLPLLPVRLVELLGERPRNAPPQNMNSLWRRVSRWHSRATRARARDWSAREWRSRCIGVKSSRARATAVRRASRVRSCGPSSRFDLVSIRCAVTEPL